MQQPVLPHVGHYQPVMSSREAIKGCREALKCKNLMLTTSALSSWEKVAEGHGRGKGGRGGCGPK